MVKMFRLAAVVMIGLVLGGAVAQRAAAEPLLTVEGVGEPRSYDLAALEALGSETITTTTIWTEGEQTFTGVPLKVLVESLGVTDGMLLATAVNDYTIEFPVADALQDGPLVAYKMNGETMSVRDKGPLWIVYPYSAGPEFQTEVVYSRSIWQLVRIEVQD